MKARLLTMTHNQSRSLRKAYLVRDWKRIILPVLEEYNGEMTNRDIPALLIKDGVRIYEFDLKKDCMIEFKKEITRAQRRLASGIDCELRITN